MKLSSKLNIYPINQFIELRMKRYKHIVQVTIGELKGAGVKAGVRCLWDSETDSYTSDLFMNVNES